MVIAPQADVELEIGERAATLELDLPPAAMEGEHPLITSKMIGKVPLADMPMEHPDGKPLDIASDFFGRPVVRTRVLPGPFQDLHEGKNNFTLWPKQTRP